MNKTLSGLILVVGPIVAVIGSQVSTYANNKTTSPANDWFYDLLNIAGAGMILSGLAMFFFGAMWFARKT